VSPDFTTHNYDTDFHTYQQALSRAAPGVPLIGPSVANLDTNRHWLAELITSAHPSLGELSAHRYPLSACEGRASRSYPTVARLLDESSSAGMTRAVRAAARLAHRAGLPFRLTELNSVTCGGLSGVSDTFATALWAPDALFELLHAGVDAVNVHIRANAINGPFSLARSGLRARPLLYGLILFARTLGPGAQLVQARVRARGALHLKVWAVRALGNVLRVLIVNKGTHNVRLALKLPAVGPASLERLLAPSARSRTGITLDGQHLGSDGTWRQAPNTPTITPGVHGYAVTVAARSATLMSVSLRPGRLRVRHSAPRRRR
jgi:hypothetical protein